MLALRHKGIYLSLISLSGKHVHINSYTNKYTKRQNPVALFSAKVDYL